MTNSLHLMLWHTIHVPVAMVKFDCQNFLFLMKFQLRWLLIQNNYLTPLHFTF